MADTPIIHDAVPGPRGNQLDKRRLMWMGIIGVLIVGGTFWNTRNPPRQRALETLEAKPPTATPPSAVSNFTRQQSLEDARQKVAMDEVAARAAREQVAARGGSPAGYDHSEPPQDQIAEDLKKRAHLARFASNLALSFREPPAKVNSVGAEVDGKNEQPLTAQRADDGAQTPFKPAKVRVEKRGEKEEKVQGESTEEQVIMEGSVLESVLVNRLDGSFAGPVICQVSVHLWSPDGQYILVPKGSRVLGEARRVGGRDEERLAVTFHRLVLTNGASIDLDKFKGLDQIGATALKDKVNKHYLSTFGTSIALGAIAGLSMSGTRGGYSVDASDMYRQGVTNELGRDARRVLDRGLQRLPTVTIREGTRVRVYFSQDIQVPASEGI